MTSKEFPTLAVMGVYTGFVLGKGPDGFAGIHEIMDHFYPGIMTIGVAAMSEDAADEVAFQRPEVKNVPGDPKDWEAYAAACLAALGPTLKLDGPLNTDEGTIRKAFADFGSISRPQADTRGKR